MSTFRQTPTYTQPLVSGSNTSAAWYRWFQGIDQGIPPSAEATVIPKASPWTYTAPAKGFIMVSGGTVVSISFARSGPFYATGQTGGTFPMSFNDQLKIVYSVTPTVVFVPQ